MSFNAQAGLPGLPASAEAPASFAVPPPVPCALSPSRSRDAPASSEEISRGLTSRLSKIDGGRFRLRRGVAAPEDTHDRTTDTAAASAGSGSCSESLSPDSTSWTISSSLSSPQPRSFTVFAATTGATCAAAAARSLMLVAVVVAVAVAVAGEAAGAGAEPRCATPLPAALRQPCRATGP